MAHGMYVHTTPHTHSEDNCRDSNGEINMQLQHLVMRELGLHTLTQFCERGMVGWHVRSDVLLHIFCEDSTYCCAYNLQTHHVHTTLHETAICLPPPPQQQQQQPYTGAQANGGDVDEFFRHGAEWFAQAVESIQHQPPTSDMLLRM